ncbi:hypothetical protein B0T11DRAFT_325805 [Plectosphaerella cucumerina]|uniref:Uncharacterized protein n=1 Tax=Plectosphaerella cucumerina TaxID=40658 RepID=A0A8K0TL22_9PEZI|nr:hypothetical protein B0T11DRAFT_325805 [Plectosphaerella cucumerina]
MSFYTSALATRTFSPMGRIHFVRPLSTGPAAAGMHTPPTGNGNPGSGLGYSPKQIWRRASPRGRFWIVVGLGVAVCAESAFWVTFGPRVLENVKGEKTE